MSSLSYLRDDYHKQVVLISESRGDSNRCTPYRENPINTLHAFHTQFVYGLEPYISRGQHRQPFASPHKDKTGPYT
jgi:hypothetical protein